MEVFRVYESLQHLGVNEANLQNFVQGYEFYLERRKMGWIPIEPPCRLVYRTKDPLSMVIMPFLIPEYAEKIWGIEVCGVMFCLLYDEVKLKPERDVLAFLEEKNKGMFGKEYYQKRSLELPIFSNLTLFRKYHTAVDDTFTLLTYNGVKFKEFGESRYWISDKNSDVPLITKFDGERYLPPFSDKRAKLRPVLHASIQYDVFCAADNKFVTPKREAFDKCMLKLSEK